MGAVTEPEALKEVLLYLKSRGIDPLNLNYPIDIPGLGVIEKPVELVLKFTETERREALLEALESSSGTKTSEQEEMCEDTHSETPAELKAFYSDFKRTASFYFKNLSPDIKELIFSKGKPKLKPYILDDTTVRVFVEYDGENISYTLSTYHDEYLIRRKAKLLVEDVKAIAEGEFLKF